MDIVTYKTSYYSFFLPVVCGLHMAGAATDNAVGTARAILLKMGQYFQIQDDYLDCFADADVLGKIGTDIQDNKCSWLVCLALQEATPEQRAIIAERYGQDNAESIARIKDVYRHAFLASCPPIVTSFLFVPVVLLIGGRGNRLQSLQVLRSKSPCGSCTCAVPRAIPCSTMLVPQVCSESLALLCPLTRNGSELKLAGRSNWREFLRSLRVTAMRR